MPRCLRYCKSTIFQANHNMLFCRNLIFKVVCDTAKVRFFKQITTSRRLFQPLHMLFAILQKYDFSSKSQLSVLWLGRDLCCLRYCKSTIFQANHNSPPRLPSPSCVVCDTAKVRFFKQITTYMICKISSYLLFAILQKYDFSSKSQQINPRWLNSVCCLRYCKSTIFQANHNHVSALHALYLLFAILQKYDFSSKSQQVCRSV